MDGLLYEFGHSCLEDIQLLPDIVSLLSKYGYNGPHLESIKGLDLQSKSKLKTNTMKKSNVIIPVQND